jgi:hypothetical protein
MNFGTAFRTRLFPRDVLMRGFCRQFFHHRFICRSFFVLHLLGLTLSTLRMHANGRIGFFSADGTHVVDLGGDEGDRFLDVHKFSEFSSLSYGQALVSGSVRQNGFDNCKMKHEYVYCSAVALLLSGGIVGSRWLGWDYLSGGVRLFLFLAPPLPLFLGFAFLFHFALPLCERILISRHELLPVSSCRDFVEA